MFPTARFSNRVADYVLHRPDYPAEMVQALVDACDLDPSWKVADIGSGTGKLTRRFLDFGCNVYGVEPNAEMRQAGEQFLSGYPNFFSVDGTAEATTLPSASVELVTAGQAFHWFDPEPTRAEFKRILVPDGWVALIWNDRHTSGTPFLDAYEQLLSKQPEYAEVGHQAKKAMGFEEFFGSMGRWIMPTSQELDWKGLLGRAVSSSYVPAVGQPGHEEFVKSLREIFERTANNGRVSFLYETQMFYGRL